MNSNEFQQTYSGKSAPEFLDSIIQNAAINLTRAKRDSLNDRLCSTAVSRHCALLAITEDKGFSAREYNTAYVLMHFFAYLRRNPDDPPDRDLYGLRFWRTQLDRWGDYRGISMAFIESPEYNELRLTP